MSNAWVYVLTNRPNGTLNVGVTSDLIRRVWQHREGVTGGFTSRYDLTKLVYVEQHETITAAIQHEKHQALITRVDARLILESNSGWIGLYPNLLSDRRYLIRRAAWMAGSSPAMTTASVARLV